jgi:hypothetical protein
MAIIPTSGEFTKVAESGGGGSAERFVVTLTPTAEDYSGTMDKTPEQIERAWQDGKDIFALFSTPYNTTVTLPLFCRVVTGDNIQFEFAIVDELNGLFIIAKTAVFAAGYNTFIYRLTPYGS